MAWRTAQPGRVAAVADVEDSAEPADGELGRERADAFDTERYKKRNEIERSVLRLKRFRKIFTRYDKLDIIFAGFIYFAMIVDVLCSVNRL